MINNFNFTYNYKPMECDPRAEGFSSLFLWNEEDSFIDLIYLNVEISWENLKKNTHANSPAPNLGTWCF
jgi:hypothetical protein